MAAKKDKKDKKEVPMKSPGAGKSQKKGKSPNGGKKGC